MRGGKKYRTFQVQAEYGDVGAIVNTVLDRVSRQNEDKDRSVLQILQEKDSQISALQSEVELLRKLPLLLFLYLVTCSLSFNIIFFILKTLKLLQKMIFDNIANFFK